MKLKNALRWVSNPKNLWIAIFIYTALIGLLVQLVILPFVFPSFHYGYGLLKGLDGSKFHRIASELAQRINVSGWSQWELQPEGQLVSGMAAIFYVLITPMPWTVLPLNGILHASACVCIFLLLDKIIQKRHISLLAALPFIFFPSNLLWNTQFHNENYVVPAFTFILLGWYILISKVPDQKKAMLRDFCIALGLILAGSFLIYLVRPKILTPLAYLYLITGFAYGMYWSIQKSALLNKIIRVLFILAACLGMLFTHTMINGTKKSSQPGTVTDTIVQDPIKELKNRSWQKSAWLPDFIDGEIRRVAMLRNNFMKAWDHAGSNIDQDVTIHSSVEVLRYLPRTAEIAFLSPFPNMWLGVGNKEAGTAMRIASAIEMIFVYFCYIFLPVFVWQNRKNSAIWMLLLVCSAMLLLYALTIPNVGALYRFRYPYLMPLVCFGFAGWVMFLAEKFILRMNGKIA